MREVLNNHYVDQFWAFLQKVLVLLIQKMTADIIINYLPYIEKQIIILVTIFALRTPVKLLLP